jgi:hypothetical protein
MKKRLCCCTVALLLLAITVGGCNKDRVVDPRRCEIDGTATVEFANKSSRTTYFVVVDGARIGTIRPKESITRVVAAGEHAVRFVDANSNENTCHASNPVFAQCSNMIMSCSADT